MNTGRSSIRAVAIALGGLLMQAGAASAQHGGGGHGGGGHGGGGHYGGGHYAGGSHYGGGGHYRGGGHYGGYGRGHYGGYSGRGHYGRYYGGHYSPRFYLYGLYGGGLYGYFGYPYYYGYGYSYPYYYGYPYYRYGGYGYGGYGYGGYGNGVYEYDDTGAVRLQVEPDEARVFVDGYYAGIADDFNGGSERLRVPGGRHEIVLKLEGHRTHRIEVYVPVGQTLRIRHRMVGGTGEDVEDLTPDGYRDETRGRRDQDQHGALSGAGPDRERGESAQHGSGELRLSVRPGDAVIYVDGEFRGPGRQVRRLELPPGRHSIEVVRPGFQTFERAVDVERDRPADLDVELRPAGS